MSKAQKNSQKNIDSRGSEKGAELEKVLVVVNKVSKTVKGGKNFSFTSLVIVGDKNGRVGYAKGNAKEVIDSKNKAFEAAKKNMIKVSLKEGRTIHHDVSGYFCAAKVNLRAAPSGTGVIAGGAMRAIFECAGIGDIVAKSVGTSNPFNMVAATFDALKNLSSPRNVADRRSLDISEVVKRRNLILGTNVAKKDNESNANSAEASVTKEAAEGSNETKN